MTKKNNIGEVHDWHNIHNGECPQNTGAIEEDCNCVQPVRRTRACDLINRKCVKTHLLNEANSRQSLRSFTQVSKSTLDAISALVKREIISRAENPPRKGKTL